MKKTRKNFQATPGFLTNTKRQALSHHLYAVARLAKRISQKMTDNTNVHQCAFLSGLMHDIGKVDPEY